MGVQFAYGTRLLSCVSCSQSNFVCCLSNKGIIRDDGSQLISHTEMLMACSGVGAGLQEVLEGFGVAMKAEIPGPGHELVVVEGAACFPLTTERAGKQYCFDSKGAIYLKTGTILV